MIQQQKTTTLLIVVFLLTICSSQSLFAQDNIATARPTESINAWTIPANTFQFEQGFSYIGDSVVADGFFRASLSDIVELRLLTIYETKDLILSTKWMALKAEDYRPGIAFSLSFASTMQVVGYRIAVEQKLSDQLTGYMNTGKAGNGYFGDLTLGISLTDKLGTYVEAYVHESFQKYATGLTFLINSETQIDVNGGYLVGLSSDYTIGFGFARRFNFQKSN